MALIMEKSENEFFLKQIRPFTEKFKSEKCLKEKRCLSDVDIFSSRNAFLPRLPEKSSKIKVGSSQFVNDFFIEAEPSIVSRFEMFIAHLTQQLVQNKNEN